MNVLFWNIGKKKTFSNVIVDVVKEESIDLIAFAEIPNNETSFFENELKKADISYTYLTPIKHTKVEVYYKSSVVDIINAYDGKRISVNKVHSNKNGNEYYLVFCHLKDAYSTDKSQLQGFARSVVKEILEHEEAVKSKRTLVCGDFNMNPYENAMIECDGFNAMPTEKIAKKGHRKVEGKSYEMFYNPMWGLMGDLNGQLVSGTYYYDPLLPIQQYWHIVDQVIMRPEMVSVFEKKQLKILSKGHTYNLLNRNNNMSNKFSDHLPIKFQLNI